MTPEQYQRVNELFLAASKRTPAERDAYLAAECDGDAELRAEVERMLAADGATQTKFLEPPAELERPIPAKLSIEGYEIVRELHRGGQGIVYQAIQRSTKRKVAVKVLLEGPFASKSARRRFEREIELVGQLKHPNIIAVFHSGETRDGHAFCVMDYIRGKTLTEYVRDKKLTLEETLKLFQTVCEAVNYAHQKGVIHRDLKPSNVIVDSDGVPKVLDFGLARQLTSPEVSLVSMTGQVVGTLPYLSPEQARGNPDEIDTRTDVYALGVMLYELLTGHYPYPVVGQMAAVLRHIAETEPTPPSRVWKSDSGITRRSSRRIKPGQCPIDAEFQTVIYKALSKERHRRYQSALDLSEDIGRYLADEPIDAKRDSTIYRLKKTIRRYRGALTFTATLTVVITAGIVSAVYMYLRSDALARRNLELELEQSKLAYRVVVEKGRLADKYVVSESVVRLPAFPAAEEAERAHAYYESWIGVRAPELGPMALDGGEGPQVRLAKYHGRPMLLFNLDAGDFVIDTFEKELESLSLILAGENLGKPAVIGFTSGRIEAFRAAAAKPVYAHAELLGRTIIDYPVLTKGFHRKFNEPYNILRSPGGIVIDRRGVIRTIHRRAMNVEQIRAAFAIDDWVGDPRPAPNRDPWAGGEPPEARYESLELWRKEVSNIVGLSSGDLDADGTEELLIVFADGRVQSIGSDGAIVAEFSTGMSFSDPRILVSRKKIAPGTNGVLFLDALHRDLSVFDKQGRKLWSYAYPPVYATAQWVDVDGDETSELVVGTINGDGLRLLSSRGELIWNNTYSWHNCAVGALDATNTRDALILSGNFDNRIHVFDTGGKLMNIIKTSEYATDFAVSTVFGGYSEPQIAILRTVQHGPFDYLMGVDLSGKVQWEYPLNTESTWGILVRATPATSECPSQWIIRASKSEVVALDHEGKLLSRFPVPSDQPHVEYAAVARKNDNAIVVIYAHDELIAYPINGNRE